jgi:hypothetical protein
MLGTVRAHSNYGDSSHGTPCIGVATIVDGELKGGTMLGPIDYIVIGFKGSNFDGSVLDELSTVVDKGIVRVVDLLFIIKDKEGRIVEGEFEDQSEDIKQTLSGLRYTERSGTPLLSDGDVAKLGEQMQADTAAGVLVIEHLWAKDLKSAIIEAGGYLIADGRIHPESVEVAMKELETAIGK